MLNLEKFYTIMGLNSRDYEVLSVEEYRAVGVGRLVMKGVVWYNSGLAEVYCLREIIKLL